MIAGDAFPLRNDSLTSPVGKQGWLRRRHARRESVSLTTKEKMGERKRECIIDGLLSPVERDYSPDVSITRSLLLKLAVQYELLRLCLLPLWSWLKSKGSLLTRYRTVVVSSLCLLFQSLQGSLIVCRRLICRFFNITVNEFHQRSFDLLSFYSLSLFLSSVLSLFLFLLRPTHSLALSSPFSCRTKYQRRKILFLCCVFFSRSLTSKQKLDLPI